jgi:hypothetical protein
MQKNALLSACRTAQKAGSKEIFFYRKEFPQSPQSPVRDCVVTETWHAASLQHLFY